MPKKEPTKNNLTLLKPQSTWMKHPVTRNTVAATLRSLTARLKVTKESLIGKHTFRSKGSPTRRSLVSNAYFYRKELAIT